MRAPFDFRNAATASRSGPVPATTIRLPSTENPDLTSACSPPAANTLGSVQPGKGRTSSRAPVARIALWKVISIASFSFSASTNSSERRATTRVDESSVAPHSRRRRSHRAASRLDDTCCAGSSVVARQICPPGKGLSSTRMAFAPDFAADTQAAMPAGPAPITRTSQLSSALLAIGIHHHAIFAEYLACALLGSAIDHSPALEANPHSAEWASHASLHRPSKS
jgi:hypothetical protein